MAGDDGGETALAAKEEPLDDYEGEQWLVPEAVNSLGLWDGVSFMLRSFPVWWRWWQVSQSEGGPEKPESGLTPGGVHWEQSMGRMALWYPLEGDRASLEEADFYVELSCWELRVSIGGPPTAKGANAGKKIEAMSGELFQDVRRKLSWWDLVVDEEGVKWLVVTLTKSLHKGWNDVWYGQPLNPHRKIHFGWTLYQTQGPKIEDETLAKLMCGMPQDLDKELCTGMTAERICTGIEESEDEQYVYILVHLDEEAIEVATDRVPMEALFSADVQPSALQVYLRNDGFGLCSGVLKGTCIPEYSTWGFTNVRRFDLPKGAVKCPAFFNPCLRIKLCKAPESTGLWGGVFDQVEKAQFQLPRERMSWTDRVTRALVLSPGAPLKTHIKTERARKLCTSVQCGQDTVTQRVNITMHLHENLEELAYRYKLDLMTFFSLKVGQQTLEVGAIADAEFTMCVGKLGGPVDPAKTTWELVKERNNPNDEKEHLALKISLAKADSAKGKWDGEVYTPMAPWEVTESLRPPEEQAALPAPIDQAAVTNEAE